jgi:hypothetical protein
MGGDENGCFANLNKANPQPSNWRVNFSAPLSR